MQEFRTRFTTDMTQHRRAMGQFRQQTSTAVADARNQLMMLAGITLGGLSVGKMVKDTIALGAEMEKTRVAFDVMLGSVEASKSAIADLMQFSDVTPFEPDEVIKAGRGLLAANVQASALTGKLEFLGNIASGTGSGLGEMVNIYMKAANKGKVQAEELNQLAERGVPIYAALANSIGVSTAEIGKMGERGELSFTLLENALISLGGEGGKYGGLMAKQSQTLDGLLSTLSGKIKLVGTTIGELAIPQLSKNISDLIAKIEEMKASGELDKIMGSAADAMINTAAVIKDLVDFIVRNRQTIVSLGFTAAGLKVISMASGLISGLAASYKAMAAASAAAKLAAAEAATATTAAGNAAATAAPKVGMLGKAAGPIIMLTYAVGSLCQMLLETDRAAEMLATHLDGVKRNPAGKQTDADLAEHYEKNIRGSKNDRVEFQGSAYGYIAYVRKREAAGNATIAQRQKEAQAEKDYVAAMEACQRELDAQAAVAKLRQDKLDAITAAEKKAAEERQKIALQRDTIDFEIKRDAMGAQIDAWKKKITDYGKQIDAVDKKLSRFGASVDEDILKTPEQIAQDKKDDLLRKKITIANKGGKVSFTAEERDRINSLREEQLKARKLKAESSDLSKQSETSEASISAEARDRAAADKTRRLKELDAREKITNAVSATASTASSDMQLKDLIKIISRIDQTLKHGLPSETK